MWVIAFFSILLVSILIYAWLVKKYSPRNESMDANEGSLEEKSGPHSFGQRKH